MILKKLFHLNFLKLIEKKEISYEKIEEIANTFFENLNIIFQNTPNIDSENFICTVEGFIKYKRPCFKIKVETGAGSFETYPDFELVIESKEFREINAISLFYGTLFPYNNEDGTIRIKNFYEEFENLWIYSKVHSQKFPEFSIEKGLFLNKNEPFAIYKKDNKVKINVGICEQKQGYIKKIYDFVKNINLSEEVKEVEFVSIEDCNIIKNKNGIIFQDFRNPDCKQILSELQFIADKDFEYFSRNAHIKIKNSKIKIFKLYDAFSYIEIKNEKLEKICLSDFLFQSIITSELTFNKPFKLFKIINGTKVTKKNYMNYCLSDLKRFEAISNGEKFVEENKEFLFSDLGSLSKMIKNFIKITDNYFVDNNLVILKSDDFLLKAFEKYFPKLMLDYCDNVKYIINCPDGRITFENEYTTFEYDGEIFEYEINKIIEIISENEKKLEDIRIYDLCNNFIFNKEKNEFEKKSWC